jgi:PAS domain S-box-containing protein
MQRSAPEQTPQCAVGENDAMFPWTASAGLALAVGVAYFFGARLGLALLRPDGVAVFWPAAGIASGLLVALGSKARIPVAVGVMVATIAANLLGDRNLASAVVFALCNAGEAILIAWVCEHRLGPGFHFDSVRNVFGFFAAAAIGTSVSGIGGSLGFVLFHSSRTPFYTTWLNWLASDTIGVVTIAPLIIGLAHTVYDSPPKSEVGKGLLILAALALMSVVCLGSPTHYWFTILPATLLFPLLLWLAANCRPVFAAAAAFILDLAIVWTITFSIGRLGDESVPFVDRVHAAQAALLVMSTCALVLAAVFAEWRRSEAVLKDNNYRLQLALDCAELGTWSLHLKSGRFENDVRDRRIHGYGPQAPPQNLAGMRSQVHPDDLPNLDAAFLALGSAGGTCRAEYRLAPYTDQERQGRERWVALEGAVVREPDGQRVQLLGVTRDITERKHAEATLRESERRSRELLGALPAAIYVTDAAGRITYCNEGAVNLWGARPKLDEDRWCDLSRLCHADGRPMAPEDFPTENAVTDGPAVRGQEAILERADGTRISIIPYPTPLHDGTGAIVGVVNMMVDISERKEAEQALAERNAQLALAGRAARVGSYAYDVDTGMLQISEGYAAIHGLPEGTTETALSQWRTRVHPEDLARVEGVRDQVFADQRNEYNVEYRIIRSDGEICWIERRSCISYRGDGRPDRVVGVTIDVTERKRVEEHQRVLVAELDHRVKNALATVSAVVCRTLETGSSTADIVSALVGRVQSMARAHELLSSRRWQGISLTELIQREIAPYATNTNIEIDGPEIMLSAEAGQAMAMVFHELVTNAAKYGALSTQCGRVLVRWNRKPNGNARARLVVEWQESGGPSVAASSKSGYGTSIVRELIPYELGGTVDFVLARDGVRCRLDIPGESLAPSLPLHFAESASAALRGGHV